MQWMQKLLFKSSVTLGMNCFLIPTICRLLTWVCMVNNNCFDSHYFQAIYTSVSLSVTDIYWFRFIHSKLYLVPFVVRKTLCRLEHFIASTLLLRYCCDVPPISILTSIILADKTWVTSHAYNSLHHCMLPRIAMHIYYYVTLNCMFTFYPCLLVMTSLIYCQWLSIVVTDDCEQYLGVTNRFHYDN